MRRSTRGCSPHPCSPAASETTPLSSRLLHKRFRKHRTVSRGRQAPIRGATDGLLPVAGRVRPLWAWVVPSQIDAPDPWVICATASVQGRSHLESVGEFRATQWRDRQRLPVFMRALRRRPPKSSLRTQKRRLGATMAARVQLREITNEEGTRLLRIVRRGAGSGVTWRRAQVVLLSAQWMSPARISEVVFPMPTRCAR
jgi:hypothetical protein